MSCSVKHLVIYLRSYNNFRCLFLEISIEGKVLDGNNYSITLMPETHQANPVEKANAALKGIGS